MEGSGNIFSQIWTVAHWKASAARRRSSVKDGAKKENERLCNELDTLHREQKKLKQVVEQLATDYEESKQYDPLRRYKRMKGIVKRTVMHFRLNPDQPDSAEGLGTGGLVQNYRTHSYQLESARRREEKYSNLSTAELTEENTQLQEQIREMRRKCSFIRDQIDVLQKSYESSKRLTFLGRYTMLKTMIQRLSYVINVCERY